MDWKIPQSPEDVPPGATCILRFEKGAVVQWNGMACRLMEPVSVSVDAKALFFPVAPGAVRTGRSAGTSAASAGGAAKGPVRES